MPRPPSPVAIGCRRSFLRVLSLVFIAIGTPLSLFAQHGELLPVESQFLTPLTWELNKAAPSPHPEMEQRPRVSYEIVSRTDSGAPAEIVAEARKGFFGYKLQITKAIADQPLVYAKELVVLSELVGNRSVRTTPLDPSLSSVEQYLFKAGRDGDAPNEAYSPYEIAETIENKRSGSSSAKATWAALELLWMKTTQPSASVMNLVSEWMGQSVGVASEQMDAALKIEIDILKRTLPLLQSLAAKEFSRKSRDLDREKAASLKELEERELKLNDLIVRNDRAGVRRLIEAYLPWSVMEPVEQRLWKNWLDAIEFPDASRKVTVFRGVDYSTDFVQRLKTPEGTRLGFMSTLLTKNQGNYTRRLRSLRTRRTETGDFVGGRWNFAPHVKISEQMKAHAIDPKSSQFLSFTLDPAVAKSFIGDARYDKWGQEKAGGGLLAVAIDSRRLFPNLRNGVTAEMEYLAPLVVFPDEVVEYREVDVQSRSDREVVFHEFLNAVRKKVGNAFQTNPLKDPKSRSKFFADGKSLTHLFFEETSGRSCRHVWN